MWKCWVGRSSSSHLFKREWPPGKGGHPSGWVHAQAKRAGDAQPSDGAINYKIKCWNGEWASSSTNMTRLNSYQLNIIAVILVLHFSQYLLIVSARIKREPQSISRCQVMKMRDWWANLCVFISYSHTIGSQWPPPSPLNPPNPSPS